jgi:hypothetical protein
MRNDQDALTVMKTFVVYKNDCMANSESENTRQSVLLKSRYSTSPSSVKKISQDHSFFLIIQGADASNSVSSTSVSLKLAA